MAKIYLKAYISLLKALFIKPGAYIQIYIMLL